MQIVLDNLSKRFGNDWIFKGLTYTFETNKPCAVVGANGSGKSTLLQLIAGIGQPTAGKLAYLAYPDKPLPTEQWYKQIAISAPYLELIEEFTLAELVRFHTQFKPLRGGLGRQDFLDAIELSHAKDKAVQYFSSGMKQRLKLGLVFYSDVPVMLLDEPTTNLDAQATNWYKKTLENNIKDRLCVICSNQPHEYEVCESVLDIMQWKNADA